MKTLMILALALMMSSGLLGQERPRESQQGQNVVPEKIYLVPQTIDFQGRLHDASGNPVNGGLGIIFKIYNTPSGGTPWWTETHGSVQAVEGLFQVTLGMNEPIYPGFFAETEQLWLAIQVQGEAEMSPRIQFSSTGFAMHALESDPTWTGNANPLDPISRSGNVGIGLTNPPAMLSVKGSGNNPTIPGSTSTGLLSLRNKDYEAIDIGKMLSYPYTGWIQAGFDQVTADPLSLNPLGGYVGIGTATPSRLLDVNGSFRLGGHLFDFNNTSGTSGQVLTRGASGVLWQTLAASPWQFNGSNIYFNTGNVGIGDSNISIARLKVKTTGSEVLALESSASSHWLAFYTAGVRKGILWMSDNTLNVRSEEGGVAIKTSGNNTRLTVEDDGDITTPLTGANKNIVPVAYGYVNQLGVLNTAKSTSNVSATVTGSAGTYNYIVTISGVIANSFIAVVTPGGDYASFPRLMYESNTFTVNFMSHTGATGQANNFSFVVFAP